MGHPTRPDQECWGWGNSWQLGAGCRVGHTQDLTGQNTQILRVPSSGYQELKEKQKNNRKVKAQNKPCFIFLPSCWKSVGVNPFSLLLSKNPVKEQWENMLTGKDLVRSAFKGACCHKGISHGVCKVLVRSSLFREECYARVYEFWRIVQPALQARTRHCSAFTPQKCVLSPPSTSESTRLCLPERNYLHLCKKSPVCCLLQRTNLGVSERISFRHSYSN